MRRVVGILAGCAVAWVSLAAVAAEPEQPPAWSEYITRIETNAATGKDRLAFDMLRDAPQAELAGIMRWEKQNSDRLHPAYTYDLAKRAFPFAASEGMRWFFVGNLRAAYDVMRCQDRSAAKVLATLTAMAGEVATHVQQHPDEALEATRRAIQWEDEHPSAYAPEWACKRGNPPGLIAEKDWPAIRQAVRQQIITTLQQRRAPQR